MRKTPRLRVHVPSYLKRVPGKKRRVRIAGYYYFLSPLPGPKPKAKAKKKVVKTRPKKAPAPIVAWEPVEDYQRRIEEEIEEEYEITEREMEIFHSSKESDFIHLPSLFVWVRPVLPTRVKLKTKNKDLAKRPFRMIRIWFWIFHNDKEEFRLWSRNSIITQSSIGQAQAKAQQLYSTVAQEIDAKFSYLETRGFVAWTAYLVGERAQRLDARATLKREFKK